jgi:hypothetical protein
MTEESFVLSFNSNAKATALCFSELFAMLITSVRLIFFTPYKKILGNFEKLLLFSRFPQLYRDLN